MTAAPRYQSLPGEGPLWASEPFRLFFPLGVAAAAFGLLLWPLHYFEWWPLYPAIQHPRLLVFGFGAAFVFGFLGTAWPRFLEAEVLERKEVLVLAGLWLFAQLAYAKAEIRWGDGFAALSCLWLLIVLGRRLAGKGRDRPPPGFALAFCAVALAVATLAGWVFGWANRSPEAHSLHRLLAYQGFLLLPLLGVGSYLFPRFFQGAEGGQGNPGIRGASPARRGAFVWSTAGLVLLSFVVEVYLSVRFGNLLRAGALFVWAAGTMPFLFRVRAPGTRAWALRVGLVLMAVAFLCRAAWPQQSFAFQHLLFLGGFCQLMLLVADRVIIGHAGEGAPPEPRSLKWRWIVWLILLTAATRATSDLVPSTRVSHHIYAALMLVGILGLWYWESGRRLFHAPEKEELSGDEVDGPGKGKKEQKKTRP